MTGTIFYCRTIALVQALSTAIFTHFLPALLSLVPASFCVLASFVVPTSFEGHGLKAHAKKWLTFFGWSSSGRFATLRPAHPKTR